MSLTYKKGVHFAKTRQGIGGLYAKAGQLPSLDLAFETQSLTDQISGKNLVTYTRPSPATYFDRNGVLRTAAPNEPRFQFDAVAGRFGYLHEPAATNLITRNTELTGWISANGAASIATSPIGPSNMLSFRENVANSEHYFQFALPLNPTGTHVHSVRFRVVGDRDVWLRPIYSSDVATASLIITSSGVAAITGATTAWSCRSLGGGWFEAAVATPTLAGTATFVAFRMQGRLTGGSATYAGDVNRGFDLYLPQVETGTAATSPILTFGATGFRAADTMTIPASDPDRGTLLQPAVTNQIRNNSMVGAVAGTPGTLPTNWSYGQLSTLSTQIVGSGVESGVSYSDIRIFGTATTTALVYLEAHSVIAAVNAQAWTHSFYIKQVAGTQSNISLFDSTLRMSNSGGTNIGFVAGLGFALASSGSNLAACRVTNTHTTNQATTAFVTPALAINTTGAIDITIRIGWPQLELGSSATAPISTSTVAVTRPAIFTSPWYNQAGGCFYIETESKTLFSGSNRFPYVAQLDNDTSNDVIGFDLSSLSSGTRNNLFIRTMGADQGETNVADQPYYTRWASRVATNDVRVAANGTLSGTDTSVTLPTVLQLKVGRGFGETYNGLIYRLTFWPPGTAQTRLQQITS